MPRRPFTVSLQCICPCHTQRYIAVTHLTACCCPHRYVVPADCPTCTATQLE